MLAVAAWLSIGLPALAAVVLARRAAGGDVDAVTVLYFAVAYAALVVVPLQAEGALELLGLVDRINLLGPAVVSGAVLAVASAGGDRPLTGPNGAGAGLLSWVGRLPRTVLVGGAVTGAVYGLFALERATGYPKSWDSVSYHLPVAARWLREGSLALSGDAHYYEAIPANGDLFSMLTLATGWPGLAELWNLVPAAAAVAGCYALARVAGADRIGRAVAAITVAGIPMVLHQTFSAYVDLFVAGFLVAAFALVARAVTDRTTEGELGTAVAAAGLACGLAVGAKATAWPVALLLAGAVAVWLTVIRRGGALGRGLLALFLVGAAAPALFWFVRNWAATGNPAYPLEITLFGNTVFEGTSPTEIVPESYGLNILGELRYWLSYPWMEHKLAGYPYSVGSGLGPLFAALVLPGVLHALWDLRAGGDRESGFRRRHRVVLAGGLVVLVACWWFVLSPVWRFGLPAVVLACALAAPFCGEFHRRLPGLFGAVLLVGVFAFGTIASFPAARSLAHRAYHGEWDWTSFYHQPPEFTSIPGDARVVNFDPGGEAWNNFALLGPELDRRVVPYWEVKTALERGELLEECPAYVVDRRPFDLQPDRAPFASGTLRLLAETDAKHGDARWRIWRLDDCEDRSAGRASGDQDAATPHSASGSGGVSTGGPRP